MLYAINFIHKNEIKKHKIAPKVAVNNDKESKEMRKAATRHFIGGP